MVSHTRNRWPVNHVTYALDTPFLLAHIYKRTGLIPRGLGDLIHFFFPGHSHVMRSDAAVAAASAETEEHIC
jgi:hypothetical protein